MIKTPEHDRISRIVASDTKAFEELFRSYYPALLRYAESLCQNRDMATDAVQQIFVNVWEKREGLGKIENIKAYLYRSCYNTCINLIKQKQLSEKAQKALSLLQPDIQQSFLLDIEAKELELKIGKTLQSLPTKCREVFELSRFEGLKNHEIARQLKISIKTVEAQISKALRILRKKLGQ